MPLRSLLLVVVLLMSGCSGGLGADDAQRVRLTAAGDYGAGPNASNVLDTIADVRPDAHIALGDLSYGQLAPESAWCEFVTSRVGDDVPFQLLAGNHDSLDVPDGDIEAFAECLPNRLPGLQGDYGREYFADLPAEEPLVRLIGVSPGLTFADGRWEYRAGDAHYDWTKQAIASARAAGIPWVVVAAHYPCWSVGVHQCPQLADFFQLLVDERVDVVLHGHEHSYARTHQLATSPVCPAVPAEATDETCLVDQDDEYQAGAGTVFVTVGTGGIDLRESDPGDPEAGYFAALNGSNVDPAHGVLELQIDPDRLRGQFVVAGPGSFRDEFTIAR